MMRNLIRKELMDNFLSFRFLVSSIIVILIMTLSVGILMQDYVAKRDSFIENQNAYFKQAEEQDNYLELMFSGIRVDRPPAELQFLYTGVEKNPNRSAQIFPFYKPSFMGELNVNPVFPLFPAVDMLFVVSIVMSLLAFVFSYDAVCGERENGTLKLLMSYSIPRDKIILAKWVGGYVTLIIPYIFGAVLCSLIILLNPGVNLSGAGWAAFFATALVALLFIAVMFSVGLFVSVKSKLPSTSISVLLFIWVIFVLVIPNSAPFLVDQIRPIDSPGIVMSKIKYKSGENLNKTLDEVFKAFEEASGFKIEEIDFGDRDGGPGGGPQEEKQDQQASAGEGGAGEETASSGRQATAGGGEAAAGAKKMPEGVDFKQLEQLAGQITDNDLRELQLKGCKTWVDKKLKEQYGITIDQAKNTAKSMGYDFDIDAILRECESRKKELIAMKQSGKSNEEIAASQGAAPQPAAPAPQPAAPRKKVKPQEAMAKIMALPPEEMDRLIDRVYNVYITAFKNNSEISKQEEETFQRSVNAQISLTKNLSRISPVSSYIYATTDIANTGIEREKDLKQYLWNYQSQLLEFLQKKFNTPLSERVHPVYGFFKEPEYKLDDLERFNYRQMALSKRISHALIDIFLLVFFTVIFFMAAFFSFLRAEIID